ncbi:MAG TPA: fibronectin type III domain-containing protein, partial [Candidatus Sulfotelmatobacter sp.]|nr:fibronectin type III domain-containing protein [Candidatus Sulfotelmatobacter sp.]
MRKALSVVTSTLLFTAAAYSSRAVESTWEYSVQVSASAQAAPAQITLSWPQDTYMLPNSYTIYKKAPGDTNWGSAVALPATTTAWTDTNVTVGTPYEYEVVKSTSLYTGYGYVYAGIQVPMTDQRGKMLLVVDNTCAAQLTNELARLQQDLVGDGWTVARMDVGRTDAVTSVKEKIKAHYDADPKNVKGVFLFGHVPVPYSGDIVPDGHAPDHRGAWPADGYYGDMDGDWTDTVVNNANASDARTRNVPGDGKFDQSFFPAPIKLMVGRVDLANLPGRMSYGGAPTFASELDLLRNYLNKDHKFRTRQFNLPRRGIVGDYFGTRDGEAFAASGWRNFAAFFNATNVTSLPTEGTWMANLHTNAYLWAYGCGAGTFTSIGGLGTADAYNDGVTTDVVRNDIKAVFTLFFGSWLGDWDSEDNIMRSVLATPTYGLTCAWSGRPHWYLQHMALGEPIGFGARLTQNNGKNGLYQNQINSTAGEIQVALMGDPSLRMHVVAPPKGVQAQRHGGSLTLNWAAARDQVVGYHVYRATHVNGPFTRLTQKPVVATHYTDAHAAGAANYMVRAVKLETSGSGTYYNPSQGAFLHPVVGASAEEADTNSVPGTDLANSGSSTNAPSSQTNSTPDTASSTNAPAGSTNTTAMATVNST